MITRICCLCGKEFVIKHPRQKVCEDQHYRKCEVCGKDIPIKRPSDPKRVCSQECEMEMRRRHNVEKYGVDHPMQLDSTKAKHRESMLEKYGVESPLQSEEIKQRAIASNMERFGSEWSLGNAHIQELRRQTLQKHLGVDYPFQSEEVRKKSAETVHKKYGVSSVAVLKGVRMKAQRTCIERYGARNPMQCRAIVAKAKSSRIKKNGQFWTQSMQDKAISTWMQNLGVDNPSKSTEVVQKIADSLQSRYGESYAARIEQFIDKTNATNYLKYGSKYYVASEDYSAHGFGCAISVANKHFADLLHEKGIEYQFEKIIELKRYDIFIPDRGILVEIDPTYTHSPIPNHFCDQPVDKLYHKEKTEIAERNGFRCIHVFDWDDPDIIVDMIAPKKVLYARNCEIRLIDADTASDFEKHNHLQGDCKGQSICYGLYHDSQLVSVMTFGAPRYNDAFQYELLRLCTLRGYAVVGGAERVFKHFITEHRPESIISYCDRSKFSGDIYLKLGFTHLRDNYPNITWSKRKQKITNNMLLARGYDQLFGTNFGKGTDNRELMIRHGWRPVYDCGQGVYVYKK